MIGPSSVNRPRVTLRAMTPADSCTTMLDCENRSGLSLRRILSWTLLALDLSSAPPATPISLTKNTSSSSGIWSTEKDKYIHMQWFFVLKTLKWLKLYNEKPVQYLIIQDDDSELHHSLSFRDGDVSSVWTEILNDLVDKNPLFKNLNRRKQ